ncbi:hypothetical protein XENOCAPTIV_018118 [Xenoophorus captivus]|uniref:Uncharacterized protein n=1 Tax=Xenoophorus captivus TaxID=1517983 RepID=A0ABV0R9H4_9TELE
MVNYCCQYRYSFELSSSSFSDLTVKGNLYIMPLHKYPPKLWEALKLKQGIYARLPKHYLKSLEQKEPTPVHWRPLGVQYRANPKTGLKERVQDVPIPIYYPPQSQDGLWGGEGWITGYRYANNDKVTSGEKLELLVLSFFCEQQFEIPEEEAEWVGLTLEEAVEKQRLLEHKTGMSVGVVMLQR